MHACICMCIYIYIPKYKLFCLYNTSYMYDFRPNHLTLNAQLL